MNYTEVTNPTAFTAALALARGCYQRNLLRGIESLSGATLRGKAALYGAHYAASRQNLLDRMTAAGVPWYERRGDYGRRVLVVGSLAGDSVRRLSVAA